jgi:hypothetical protein
MRFERRDPRVYVCHARFVASLAACVAVPGLVRAARRRGQRCPRVALWGHSLDGNLRALFDHARRTASLPFSVDYFTIDDREHARLRALGDDPVLLTTPGRVRDLLECRCIVTTHGPGALQLLWKLPDPPRFVDVWHGLAFKGYVPGDFDRNRIHRYDAVLVASEHQRALYRERYGFRDEQLHVTGYARVDRFVAQSEAIRVRCRAELGLAQDGPVVLYAPTWRNAADSGEIPFGLSPDDFVNALDEIARNNHAAVILRFHRNSPVRLSGTPAVRVLPQREYPETNDLLCAADVVVTDWSSVAVDCYALGRRVVFLDVPPPAAFLGITEVRRAGPLARSAEELGRHIALALGASPAEVAEEQRQARDECYGSTLDGRSAERYCEVLSALLSR